MSNAFRPSPRMGDEGEAGGWDSLQPTTLPVASGCPTVAAGCPPSVGPLAPPGGARRAVPELCDARSLDVSAFQGGGRWTGERAVDEPRPQLCQAPSRETNNRR